MSRDIPIIFSAPMVLALLAGRKTMTRRLSRLPLNLKTKRIAAGLGYRPSPWQNVKSGDRLWVRENFARNANQISDTFMDTSIVYAADDRGRALDNGTEKPWTPCIHMPRWASRITLVITDTKVDQLQDMSHDDAIAEGVELTESGFGVRGPQGGWLGTSFSTPQSAFSYLWMSLHGSQSWDANPEVVALNFTVHHCNIDKMEFNR